MVACGIFFADNEIDFDDLKSNVVRANSVRVLLSITAALDLKIKGVDIVQAFLQADKESGDPVYMRMAKGHETEGIVLRLIKSVYGLREVPILFERLLSGWLTDMGFERLQSDKSIYKLDSNGRFLIVAAYRYVDDIIILHKRDEDHE